MGWKPVEEDSFQQPLAFTHVPALHANTQMHLTTLTDTISMNRMEERGQVF